MRISAADDNHAAEPAEWEADGGKATIFEARSGASRLVAAAGEWSAFAVTGFAKRLP